MTERSHEPERPNPDDVLAEVNAQQARERRGKLKVFFGMSAGVGKTYAMLEEARKRAAEGINVLVGYAEPHIRPETEAILIGLDILPYRIIRYRDADLKEFDLDAALQRRPDYCCVDELAHTNAPGTRHPKRYQDVIELLDAGINVYTTLNVQHLQSVNDLVERITGVRVRETLPDAIFDSADEVELVDIAPEELLERIHEGRIYRPEQAARAGKHFFTKGNLIALREMALRKTADRVDEQMQQHRRDERLSHLVPASEKVLVCVGPSPLSARLIRSARRLSTGLRAKLIAVSVDAPGATPRSTHGLKQIEENLRLAEELGAQIVSLTGHNVANEVLAYAMAHNVTKIVVGKPARARWKDFLFGSVVDDLIRRSGEIDIYVIRSEAETADPRPAAPMAHARPIDWHGCAMATLIVLLTTLIGWPLHHRLHLENVNILMLYLVGILWVAVRRSRTAAIVASVLSVLAFDLTFVPPYYTLSVSDRQYIVTFVVMLLTAFVISALTHRVRAQAESARARERRTAAILQLSHDLSIARTASQIAAAVSTHIRDAFGGRATVLLPDATHVFHPNEASAANAESMPDTNELAVAQWAAEHAETAGNGTGTLPASLGRYLPMIDGEKVVGVLAVYPPADQSNLTIEQRDLAQAMNMQAAVAMGRVALSDEARAAWERVESESLRNTLLSGVSHELRTPLAGITGAATALAQAPSTLDELSRREMLETVISEAARMERLINNLLDMSRLEAGGLSLKREWTPIAEVIGATLGAFNHRLCGHQVRTAMPDDLPLVFIDGAAIEQVLANLLDNAVEYSHTPSPIEIGVRLDQDRLVIDVSDSGPGLPPDALKRVFDKFYRVDPSAPRRGVGLGLAICRALVEAHGGAIQAMNRPADGPNPRGATFRVTLPTGGSPPVIDSTG